VKTRFLWPCRWRDSGRAGRNSVTKLDAGRVHEPPPAGFVMIRHFGLLANRNHRPREVLILFAARIAPHHDPRRGDRQIGELE
jgi:hypothetical protein